ncbi:GvpL/GvpF family gas vesicle protein [Citricoccus sp. GCM10030269]|uniref:GvpL/GvpF family gas vesicle protein n=1 Tax=Citricoccus sp. GCM10030269 TaxID=3273388 RepID=UPI0036159A6B
MTGSFVDDSGQLYLYGIVAAGTVLPEDFVGIEQREVTTVGEGSVAGLVTPLEPSDDFGTPDGLLAHSTVLDAVAREHAVLPMAFGTVVPGEAELIDEVLAPRHDEFTAALARVDDAVQFTLRARYRREEALAQMVSEIPEVARLREAIAGTTEDETRSERIQLGELIVGAFDRMRPADSRQIVGALSSSARDIVHREIGQAEDIVEMAMLVPRNGQAQFEEAVENVAAELHTRIEFRLVGPQAPYDFVNGE